MTVNFCFMTADSGQSCAVGAAAFASERIFFFFGSLCSSVLSTFLIRPPSSNHFKVSCQGQYLSDLEAKPEARSFLSPPPPHSPLMSASCVGAAKVSHPFLHVPLPGIQSLFQLYWAGDGVFPSAGSQRHKQLFALSFTSTAAGNLELPISLM